MRRQLLWGSLLLAPATIAVDKVTGAGDVALFVLAAMALIPLAWLIGESTEHAAEHTGPGIGGFLNASFGNAPELIVALFAVGARGAKPLLVAGTCELPHAVEDGSALTVELLDRHHGELPVLGIDPAASAHGQGAKDQQSQQTRQQFRMGH